MFIGRWIDARALIMNSAVAIVNSVVVIMSPCRSTLKATPWEDGADPHFNSAAATMDFLSHNTEGFFWIE
jgi:hypothetical protein